MLDPSLPEFLPVPRYGLVSRLPNRETLTIGPAYNAEISASQLPSLFSKVLLEYAIEFESKSRLSLAICANIIRFLYAEGDAETGVLVRDLPRLSGVSKEAISMLVGYLVRHGFASLKADPAAKGAKSVRLLETGSAAKRQYELLLNSIEKAWTNKYEAEVIERLRRSLEALYPNSGEVEPKLSEGLHPYPDGWRARKHYVTQTNAVLRDPVGNLPHFPMVLHRGGYPDGS